jgi:hypothetical protein
MALLVSACRHYPLPEEQAENRLRWHKGALDDIQDGCRETSSALRSLTWKGKRARRSGKPSQTFYDDWIELGLVYGVPEQDALGNWVGITIATSFSSWDTTRGVFSNSMIVGWARRPERGSSATHDVSRLGWRFWRSLTANMWASPLAYVGADFGGIWDTDPSGTRGGMYAEALVGMSFAEHGRGVNLILSYMAAEPGDVALGSFIVRMTVPF